MVDNKNPRLEIMFLTDEELAEKVRQVERRDPLYWAYSSEAQRRLKDFRERGELLLSALENIRTGTSSQPPLHPVGETPKVEKQPAGLLSDEDLRDIERGARPFMNLQTFAGMTFIAVLATVAVAQNFWG